MPELDDGNTKGGATAKAQAKTGVEPPADWQKVYAGIEEMRFRPGGAAWKAPVDTVGCSQLANPNSDEPTRRYHTLCSLMLSSQTKDPVTAAAMGNLHEHWPDGLTVDNMIAEDPEVIDRLICKVGFHKRKVVYLQQTAAILKEKYGGDIPPDIEGLMALPGVGPKMGYLTMQVAWRSTQGIGVDTHVHRISNRLGWVGKKQTPTPEHTRLALEKWMPREYWGVVNLLLVGLGQKVCLPINPRCADCRINSLCPTGRTNLRYSKDPDKFFPVPELKSVKQLHGEDMMAAAKGLRENGHGAAAAAASAEGVKTEDEPGGPSAAARAGMLKAGFPDRDAVVKKEGESADDGPSASSLAFMAKAEFQHFGDVKNGVKQEHRPAPAAAADAGSAVDEFVSEQPEDVRSRLQAIRKRIHKVVGPTVTEEMRYGIPAFRLGPKYHLYMANWKGHVSLYPIPLDRDDKFEEMVGSYRKTMTKDNIHLMHNKPLPEDVLDAVIKEATKVSAETSIKKESPVKPAVKKEEDVAEKEEEEEEEEELGRSRSASSFLKSSKRAKK